MSGGYSYRIIFDGSTTPGTVTLMDDVIRAQARFDTEEEAKLFYGLLVDMNDDLTTARERIARVNSLINLTMKEAQR